MIAFLDCEFTDLLHPELLSLGLVSLDDREHYVELDLISEAGQARKKSSSDFVRFGGVLDMWGRVHGAASTEWELGRRTGEWLLSLAAEGGTSHIEVAFDYSTDYELLEDAIRDAGLWDRVREVVVPVNVSGIAGTIDGELAAEECYRTLSRRGLSRHHSLADALALRAAYVMVKDTTLRMNNLVRSPVYGRLLAVLGLVPVGQQPGAEGWLRWWLCVHAVGLGGRRPLDVLEDKDGEQIVIDLLTRIEHGVYS